MKTVVYLAEKGQITMKVALFLQTKTVFVTCLLLTVSN